MPKFITKSATELQCNKNQVTIQKQVQSPRPRYCPNRTQSLRKYTDDESSMQKKKKERLVNDSSSLTRMSIRDTNISTPFRILIASIKWVPKKERGWYCIRKIFWLRPTCKMWKLGNLRFKHIVGNHMQVPARIAGQGNLLPSALHISPSSKNPKDRTRKAQEHRHIYFSFYHFQLELCF